MDTDNHTYPVAVITFSWSITVFQVEWRDNEKLMNGSFFVLGGILYILLQESKRRKQTFQSI